MIERNKKTTEITMGDKLVNKNNINSKKKKKDNSLLNEFVGGNKLINENNIIIKMPEETVKKKRKKKQKKGIAQAGEIQQGEKKISDIAKINYQETLNKFEAGNYPKFPMPDISTIKTDADLNKITNMMKLQMNETPIPIDNLVGTRTNISSPIAPIPVAPIAVRPVLTETTTIDASIPAVAKTSDILPPISKQPIDLSILLENEKEFIGLFDNFYITIANFYNEKDDKTNLLIGLNYYKNNKDLFDNTSDDKLKEQINKYIERDYFDMSDKDKELLKDDFKIQFEDYKLSHVLDKTKTIKSNKKESNISKTLIDEEKENLKNEVIELSKDREKLIDEIDKMKTSQNNLFDIDPLYNQLQKEIELKMDLEDEKAQLLETINKLLKEKNNESIELLIIENKEINKKIDENDDSLTPEQLDEFFNSLKSKSALESKLTKESSTKQPTESSTKQSYISGDSPSYIPQSVMSSPISEQSVMSSPNSQPVKAPPKSKDFIYTYVSGQANNYNPEEYGEAGLAEATSNPEIFYKTFYPNGIYTQKTFPLDDPKMALYPQKNDFLRVINNIPSTAGITKKKVPQLEIIFKDEYLKSLEIPKNVPVDLPKLDNSLQGIDKLMNFMNVYFPSNGLNRVFVPDAPLGNSTEKANNPTEKELIKIINEFIIPKKEEYKSHYFKQYEKNGNGYKKGDYKPYLISSSTNQSSVTARDKAAIELLKDFTELYPESVVEPEAPEVPLEAPAPQEQCLDSSRRDANCIKLSDYYKYLNNLSNTGERTKLNNEYIKATGDDFNYIDASNSIKIEKIKEINYIPNGKKNPEFFTWIEAEKRKIVEPTSTQQIAFLSPEEYKRSILLLTVENDADKINAYFNGLMQWNSDNGSFERIPRNLSTEDKLGWLIRYKNQYQYTDINQPVKRKKPLIDNNEVQLCFEICKATYIEPSSREQISQLTYDDTLSNAEVAIYRDPTTNIIYFGSRGSQTAEDWLMSDLAIVFGKATNNFSPRLNNEITILNQVISIYRPTTIIYCGHSLASYLSDELFIYTLKSLPNITQVFSIGFNGGRGLPAYYRDNPFDENFINTHVLQFHIKGDALSMTQRYAPFGTLVNVPVSSFLLIPNHFLSAFDNFNFEPYSNFVDNGLTINNPDQVIEETTQPVEAPVEAPVEVPVEAPQPAEPTPAEPTPSESKPYSTPIGGAIGAVIGGALGGLTSAGNPAVIGGTAAAGFLAGDAIQRNLPALPEPTPPPPPRPIYMPPPPITGTQLSPILFGAGKSGGKKFRFPFP
jgi:hypothetical protein